MKRTYEKPSTTVVEFAYSTQILSLSDEPPLPSNYDRIPFTDEECDDPA